MNTIHNFSFDEMDAYLTARQRGEAAITSSQSRSIEHAAMIDQLVNLSNKIQPDPDFTKALETRLLQAVGRDIAPSAQFNKPSLDKPFFKEIQGRKPFMTRTATYALACIAILVILGTSALFLIRQIKPEPAVVMTQGTSEVTSSPGSAITQTTPAHTLFPTPSQPPILPSLAQAMGMGYGGGGGSQIPTGLRFNHGIELPPGPSEMTAYFIQNAPPMTLESARQVVAQWQPNASLYMTPGVAELPPDSPTERFYFAFDGMNQLVIEGNRVSYQNAKILPVYGGHQYPAAVLPPVEESLATATQFLESRGQLGFPYSTGTSRYAYGMLAFHRMLDGWRLKSPVAWVQVDSMGQIGAAYSETLDLQPVGSYPIISAHEAWQLLTTDSTSERILISIRPAADGNPKYWGRVHPMGQTAHLFGALDYLALPADPGGYPRISLNNLVLEGDLSGLVQQAQANQGYFHIWGMMQEINGVNSLQVEGWEPFDEFSGYFNGRVSRQADGDYLLLEDGSSLRLPDLPGDVPDGEPLYVNGGRVGETLEWFILQVHPAGEGQYPPSLSSSDALIDQVELIYLEPARSLPPGMNQDVAYRMMQPVWYFEGQLGEDHIIEIYIQAAR